MSEIIIINGVETKRALPPHNDKILWKPRRDWIRREMTVSEFEAFALMNTKKEKEKAEGRDLNKHERHSRLESEEIVLGILKTSSISMTVSEIQDAGDLGRSTVHKAIAALKSSSVRAEAARQCLFGPRKTVTWGLIA